MALDAGLPMTARYLPIAAICVMLTQLGELEARAANVLLVTDNNGTLTSQESLRRSRFQSSGHTVNTIWDGASQATFNTAFAANDVVYVSEEVNPADVAYKVRSAPIGVVSEERFLDAELGVSTSDGSTTSERRINITDNTHKITSSFSTGLLQIVTNWQDLVYLSGSRAPGGQTLATIGGAPALFVIDTGGTLANTYSGNSTAAGRRVRLPFGDTNFDFSRLNASGRTLLQNALLWAANRAPALVGHWKLNETSGTTAHDSSTFARNGTVYGGANWSTRCSSVRVFNFSGNSNYVRINNASNLQPALALTIAAWIKGDAWGSGTAVNAILRKGETDPNNYQLAIADGRVAFYLNALDTGGIRGNTVLTPGQWYHVAAVWDGSTVSIYVNGQLDNVPVARTGTTGIDTRRLYIGGRAGADCFDGMIYDVRLYNYGLTLPEIAQVYGLVGHWKLDETSGTTAADSSLAGNDGVYTNNPTLGVSHTPFDDGVALAVGFDGVDDYVEIPYDASLDSQSYTVSAWVYCTEISDAFESGILGTRNGVEYGFDVKVDPGVVHGDIPAVGDSWLDTSVDIRETDTGSNGQGGQLALSHWYLVTYVVDGASNTANLYLDGDLKRTISLSGTPRFIRPGQTLMIGNSAIAYGEFFHGRIDDVRLYNRPLCPTEIQEIYSIGSGSATGVRIIKWVEIQ
jgi:hypothetical protein